MGSPLVAQRTYTYDILGRPTARHTARQGRVVSDTFAHNSHTTAVEDSSGVASRTGSRKRER